MRSSSSSVPSFPSLLNLISGAAIPARNLDNVVNCFVDEVKACGCREGLKVVGLG